MDFVINGVKWGIQYVRGADKRLMRSDGTLTLGVTDWNDKTVYLSDALHGDLLTKVVAHELVHCFMFAFSIHIPIEQEEFVADWVATYGVDLVFLLDELLQNMTRRRFA